jgi:hypothetical protein
MADRPSIPFYRLSEVEPPTENDILVSVGGNVFEATYTWAAYSYGAVAKREMWWRASGDDGALSLPEDFLWSPMPEPASGETAEPMASLPFTNLEGTLAAARRNAKESVNIFDMVHRVAKQDVHVRVVVEIDGRSVEMVGRLVEQTDTPDATYLKFSARKGVDRQ